MTDALHSQDAAPAPVEFPPIPDHMIFVFGSNESGYHVGGAARDACMQYGARTGIGFGRQGRSFAIPTMDWELKPLHIRVVEFYVKRFVAYSKLHTNFEFFVTKVGCGIAGFKEEEIAPFFLGAPDTVTLPDGWREIIKAFDDKINAVLNYGSMG